MTIKILVTGGTGLVGNGVQYALSKEQKNKKEEWVFVNSKDADLTKTEEVNVLFEKHKPDYVVHLASMVGGVYKNITENVNFFVNNMLININVLNCCYNFKVKKIFSCLSTCIFSMNDKLPFSETSSINGDVHFSNSGYALSKRYLTILNKFFNDCNRSTHEDFLVGKFMSFTPCNIFGPCDNFNAVESHFIPALIKKMYESERDKKPLIIYGDGTAKRQFIYSRDLGKLIIWLVRNYDDDETIILSPDDTAEYSISEIVNTTASMFNFSQDILYDTTQCNGVFSRTVTNKKLQELYKKNQGFDFKFISYEQAIKETMNWFTMRAKEFI